MAQERRFHGTSLSASCMPVPSGGLKHSRSLMISPNLDKLLEFEERHRRAVTTRNSPTRADNDMAPNPLVTPRTPASLPPPPRGPRGSKSLPSELTAFYGMGESKRKSEMPPATVSSSVSNPFINPAPTLEELPLAKGGLAASAQLKAETGREGKGAVISAFPGQFTSNDEKSRRAFKRTIDQEHHQGVDDGNSHVQVRGLRVSPRPSSPMFDFLNLLSSTDQKSPSHSFIDLFSSTQTSPINDSNDFDGLMRSSSTKASATPRPLFDRSLKNRHTSSPARGFSSPSLPPTTNLLDTTERAGLIRKSKKLAHVFGQTPEAGALLHGMDSQLPPAAVTSTPPSSLASRRHSLPLSLSTTARQSADSADVNAKMRLPVSFIDLSDEDDTFSAIIPSPSPGRRRCSISSISPSEIPSPEALAEEARRRKREKLAKLHRFLGSRVPASLAFGLDDPDSSLPPEMFPPPSGYHSSQNISGRRRSSSVSGSPPVWGHDFDRIKADLGNKEKAINVKRAQKMEKVFGVAPPQTLYHTRHVFSPSEPSIVGFDALHQQGNLNRTAYTKNKKKESRPGSSESSQELLPKHSNATRDSAALWSALITKSKGRSEVYSHYQHSLNSLHDILDRDDKASLAELHQYLNGSPTTSPSSPVFQFSPTKQTTDRRASNASSAKSDRRRSLPTRTSMVSIASEASITSPKPDLSDFQLRRRRAAKLTNFFGVDYRELVNDVLESIESGLEHERKRGALQADEVEDLLQKLRELRIKRKDIC